MKKSDLETGWRIKVRMGRTYLVLKDCNMSIEHEDYFFTNFATGGYLIGSDYNDDLTLKSDNREFDIMEIAAPSSAINILDPTSWGTIWTRQEPKCYLCGKDATTKIHSIDLCQGCKDLHESTVKIAKKLWEVEHG